MSTKTVTKQFRSLPGMEIRSIDEGKRQFVARVCNYNVVDSYGTVWLPGCFADSLKRKKPKVVWAHDWTDPIGVVIDYDDTTEHLDVTVQLDDFDDVPRARQCFSQLKSGSMDEFSFGFAREEWSFVDGFAEDAQFPGAYETMTRARLDEVSPVLVGAVPNTQLLSTRSAERVGRSEAAALLTRVAAGAMPLSEALRALEAPASGDQVVPAPDGPETGVRASTLIDAAQEALSKMKPEDLPEEMQTALQALVDGLPDSDEEPDENVQDDTQVEAIDEAEIDDALALTSHI